MSVKIWPHQAYTRHIQIRTIHPFRLVLCIKHDEMRKEDEKKTATNAEFVLWLQLSVRTTLPAARHILTQTRRFIYMIVNRVATSERARERKKAQQTRAYASWLCQPVEPGWRLEI